MKFTWSKNSHAGFEAAMPDNVTLVVTPDRLAKGLAPKAARGTQWRAQCSHWDESARCLSRFGRDAYMDLQPSYKAAMRLAESIYIDATLSAIRKSIESETVSYDQIAELQSIGETNPELLAGDTVLAEWAGLPA